MRYTAESTDWDTEPVGVGVREWGASAPVELDDLPLPVYQARPDGRLIRWNVALWRLLGSEEEYPPSPVPRLADLLETPAEWEQMIDLVERDGRVDGFETRIRRLDGDSIWVEHTLRRIPVDSSAEMDSVIGSMRNISQWKEREDQLRHDALHDALTQLPTRSVFFSRLEQALNRLQRRRRELVAVLFMDLDGFKAVNDDLGHFAGDGVLMSVAERVGECLRPEDTFCRFGGDEFAVILEGLHDADAAFEVAGRIRRAVSQPIRLPTEEVKVDVSIGLAVARSGEEEPDVLVRRADYAMYQAKATGGGTVKTSDLADPSGNDGPDPHGGRVKGTSPQSEGD